MSLQLRLMRSSIPISGIVYSHYSIRNLSESSAAVITTSQLPNDIAIYQYKICPYCNRPKTFLDYLNVPYKAIEVNPLTKSQLSFSKDYKKVPIMTIEEQDILVTDSIKIIETLKLILSKNAEKKKTIEKLFTPDT